MLFEKAPGSDAMPPGVGAPKNERRAEESAPRGIEFVFDRLGLHRNAGFQRFI